MNTTKKARVLVVDDQPKILCFIEVNLKLNGFEVLTATAAEEALKLVKSAEPDIMLLDIVMPDMDGFEALRRLRDFSIVPVIAFSASPNLKNEAIRFGANDFLHKPFTPENMVGKIRQFLKC